jgi:hypothetical protein
MYHDWPKGSYRNDVYGLFNLYRLWPKMDWYCHCEYDVLFTSSDFKEDLLRASEHGIWMLGNDYREENYQFPLLESMLKTKFSGSKYLLGCCVFYNGEFVRRMMEINFFERFLNLTNGFANGFFPNYEEQGGFSLTEHLFPTMAHHLGGKIKELANWRFDKSQGYKWDGNYKRYPMRFRPELAEKENFPEASVMHPLKKFEHPIRKLHRLKREIVNKKKNESRTKNFGLRGGLNFHANYDYAKRTV